MSIHVIERVQKELPHDVPLWHVHYVEPTTVEARRLRKSLYLAFNCLKQSRYREPRPERELPPERTVRNSGRCGWWGRTGLGSACLLRGLSVSHCLCLARQAFVCQTFTLSIFLWIVFIPSKAPNPHAPLFSSERHKQLQLPGCWAASCWAHRAPIRTLFFFSC